VVTAAVIAAALVAPSAMPAQARAPRVERSAPSASAFQRSPAQRAQDRQLLAVVDPRADVSRHAETGRVRFIGGSPARPAIAAADLGRPATARAAASAFLFRFGPLIGVAQPRLDLRLTRTRRADRGRTFFRYQQLDRGVAVMGGDLIVQVGADGGLISFTGEASPGVAGPVRPSIAASRARRAAVIAVARASDRPAATLRTTRPETRVWDPRLVGGPGLPIAVPAWVLDVRSPDGSVDQQVVVDGRTGRVLARMDQVHRLAPLRICDQHNDRTGEGTYGNRTPCDPGEQLGDPGASIITDVRVTYDALRGTLDFYADHFERDGIADDGAAVIATVRYCPSSSGGSCPYANAAFLPSLGQMVIGDGFASDDVIGHELTHGVTNDESDLFYYFESGAINEALSDIFGEAIDQETPVGLDGKRQKWLIGEDLPGGAVRDMAEPAVHGQPDRMSSSFWYAGSSDNGGVHTNSGVANKTAFLMQDGGTFNGRTVTGLKRSKAIAIWYEVATNLLATGSDHRDLADVLPQACRDLVGTVPLDDGGTPNPNGAITNADCTQVERAVAATELALIVPGATPASDDLCHDSSPDYVVNESFSGTEDDWTVNDAPTWVITTTYANSGTHAMLVRDDDDPFTATLTQFAGVTIPSARPVFLSFRHALSSSLVPNGLSPYAAVVEASVLPASPWLDLEPLWIFNGYNAVSDDTGGQPLGTRDTFVGPSRGWALSKANLSGYGGLGVKVRFRLGSRGYQAGASVWFLDDVRIYTCVDNGDGTGPTGSPTLDLRTGTLGAVDTPVRVTVRANVSDPSGIAETDHGYKRGSGSWQDVGQSSVAVTNQGFGVASTSDTQTFRVKAQDEQGNWSAWRSVSGVLKLRQENTTSPAITYIGSWGTSSGSGFSGGGARFASAAGRVAKLRVERVTDLAWVTTKGPDRGKAEVWIDGVKKKKIDLYAAERTHQQVVYAISFSSAGTHRIEIRPTGTKHSASTGTRVDIDAFETIQAP
jgi:Zn-dependent metalloprotease